MSWGERFTSSQNLKQSLFSSNTPMAYIWMFNSFGVYFERLIWGVGVNFFPIKWIDDSLSHNHLFFPPDLRYLFYHILNSHRCLFVTRIYSFSLVPIPSYFYYCSFWLYILVFRSRESSLLIMLIFQEFHSFFAIYSVIWILGSNCHVLKTASL